MTTTYNKQGKNVKVFIPSKDADELGIKENPVTITHTISVAGYNLAKGMKMVVTRVYFRNGETQLEGFVNARKDKEEVAATWTNVEFI